MQDVVEEEGQGGLDPHTAVENSWVLIEGRPSEVLDQAAAGVLQGSDLGKIPGSQSCCSLLLAAAQQSWEGQEFLELNSKIQYIPFRT